MLPMPGLRRAVWLEENDFTLVTLVDEADGNGTGTAQAA